MPATEEIRRRHCIPIIYTRGTHYEVGYDVGHTFSGVIHSFLKQYECMDELQEAYETPQGRKAYEDTLNCLKTNFPQYIRELEGTADGSGVPFYKLFLLHLDNIIVNAADKKIQNEPTGCSTICVNQYDQQLLGHTEDALASTLNHFYFVSAHIISDKPQGRWNVKEEKFTSLCYAGHLPGYTMSYNHHGLVFSINTLTAKATKAGRTPRHFLTRALLGAENFVQAQQILKDSGCGAADGCSVNMTFLNQDGDRMFHNAEMAPCEKLNESELSFLTASPGENIVHCNSYMRLNTSEGNQKMTESSVVRLRTFNKYKKPKNKDDLINMLSDTSHDTYNVFRDVKDGYVRTIAVGIFDCLKKTWALYGDNPKDTEPLVVLPLDIKV